MIFIYSTFIATKLLITDLLLGMEHALLQQNVLQKGDPLQEIVHQGK